MHSCSFPSVAVKNSHGKLDTGETLHCSLVVRANYCATQLFKAAKLFTSFEKKNQFSVWNFTSQTQRDPYMILSVLVTQIY